MIAKLLFPVNELSLGKIRWSFVFDHRTLLLVEREVGKDILLGELDLWRPDSKTLKGILVATGAPRDMDWRLLTPRTIPLALGVVQKAWVDAMPTVPAKALGKRKRKRQEAPDNEGPRSWLHAWGNARTYLGLSDEEWLSYTPRMVQELSLLRKEILCQNEWMFAQICSQIANWSQHPPEKAIDPKIFMLHEWEGLEKKDEPREYASQGLRTPEEQLRGFMNSKMIRKEDKRKIREIIN